MTIKMLFNGTLGHKSDCNCTMCQFWQNHDKLNDKFNKLLKLKNEYKPEQDFDTWEEKKGER